MDDRYCRWKSPELRELPPISLRAPDGAAVCQIPGIAARMMRVADILKRPLSRVALAGFRGKGPYYPASSYLGNLGTGILEKIFKSPEELAAVSFSAESSFDIDWDAMMRKAKAPWVLRRIVQTAWIDSYRNVSWDAAVSAYEGLRKFTLGLPGFTYHLDFAAMSLNRGYSTDRRVFLDGSIGILIHFKGAHVMTIGFDLVPSKTGRMQAILRQVQLVNKRGNRFLFKMAPGYYEFVCAAFREAFSSLDVLVTRPDEVVRRVSCGYGDVVEKREAFLTNDAPRLLRLYGQRFRLLVRRGRSRRDGTQYLIPGIFNL